ncbi:hypothetical protein BDV37DRAFT_265090 [Aspergillus pseudonomiae]|uniref:Uncharacterized protein n=1 Tax=Aspergillus pseudonomiae TaxID=1506151 RepID=A0A5N7CU26_9EURO|nr:uncharacterized protein BDV37DRAFT_265090 [Aspergillus pseudonomiae]KAE8397706.1 hypothetical protein BDV37DRAFT_265090 [Aspergillus pseudonomiae]
MKYAAVLTTVAALASQALAVGVSGTAQGFASSTTGVELPLLSTPLPPMSWSPTLVTMRPV